MSVESAVPTARDLTPPDPGLVIATAQDAILTKTLDGIVTSWNPGAEQLYGYTAAEMVGRHIRAVVPPDRLPELEDVITRAARGERVPPLDTERMTKDGRRIRVSLALSPVYVEGRPVAISAVARDITAQVRAEEALHRAAESLRAVVESSPVATKILDLEGRVQYWSPAAEAMLGWTAEEVVGRDPPTVPPEDAARHAHLRERVSAGDVVVGLEATRLRKDGRRLEVLVYGAPRRDETGRVVGVVELLADVTQRRELEEQLVHAQKLEAIGRLAGGVAHDFNNILTAILGHVEPLLAETAGEDVSLHARAIRDAAQRGAGLTGQLLTFSRRQVVQPRVLDLNAEVRAAEGMLRPLVSEAIEMRINTGDDAGHVRLDPTQLQQVILNLAVNARDAMPRGGVLTIETGSGEFTEAYADENAEVQPGRYAVLAVSDTGTGMDRETRRHIFEPFFTTKPEGLGTGLGLATTYGIVRQAGGQIWLYSEPGRGTVFKVYLPLVGAPLEPAPTTKPGALAPGSGRILLVEDDDLVRDIERRLLERLGYQVLVARDGVEALAIARSEGLRGLDLVISDVVMPRVSGPQLVTELHADRPDLPVLLLSGYAEEVVARGVELGEEPSDRTAFLSKPFTPDTLARRVREVIAGGDRDASDEAPTPIAAVPPPNPRG